MVQSVGIDFHGGLHQARCLDERAQLCDGFSFLSSRDEGLCLGRLWGVARKRGGLRLSKAASIMARYSASFAAPSDCHQSACSQIVPLLLIYNKF